MNIKIMKREEAESRGLLYFYTGKKCKWGSISPRFTHKGTSHAKNVLGLEYATTGMCVHCAKLMQEGEGSIGESFESIMGRWDSTTHRLDTKKLPYLRGTSSMGYFVRGFTYVSAQDYDKCSKLLWVKAKKYIKASTSKDNRKRAEENIKELYGKCVFLHRYVLGLPKGSESVGDHIKGYTLDNRLNKIRICTLSENNYNSKKRSKGTSKYKGVDKIAGFSGKSWRTRLYINGKYKTGHFRTEDEAALYYNTLLDLYRPSKYNVYNVIE